MTFRDGVSYTLLDHRGGIFSSWSRNLNDYRFLADLPMVAAARADPRSAVWTGFETSFVAEPPVSNRKQLSLARSVEDPLFSRSYLGVLILSIDEGVVRDIFRRYGEPTRQQAVALLADDGTLLTAYDPAGLGGEAAGGRHLVTRRTLRLPAGPRGMPWHIVSLASTTAISETVTRLTRGLSLGFAMVLAAVGSIAGLLSSRLVRPIVALSRVMKEWSLDVEDGFTPSRRRDEVGELERSFAAMRAGTRELFERVRGEHEARERYRYQALRSQLNPHFLFNSLNMIRWLAIIHKSEPIVRSIDALSGLLGYSMGRDGDWAALGEELTAVSRYLLIHNHRFGATFSLQEEVGEDLRSALVLKFLLQPIVENSVLHGYGDAEGGVIRVRALREDGALAIVVEDDGVGIPPEVAAGLFEKPRECDRAAGKVTSLGLFNVNEMIKISCGERFGLSVRSQPGRGCAVRCEIPVRFARPPAPAGPA